MDFLTLNGLAAFHISISLISGLYSRRNLIIAQSKIYDKKWAEEESWIPSPGYVAWLPSTS